ncbi:uncharacterized protein LOC115622792 isoform X2 [Scaptodrosophila lebanonensis]|uniref:Uncharacterized protein LOC115622792 isoform X2 n=1 Tax=Drosophila lebanonensis TaxID=7225 RepID=A0A6J2T706_DROLE|nr:uncharacterized protein LOC115622792 isoform X2 [Scaptodrosophila lebanonensis]
MSRNSDKLNIIDENTYKKLQNRQNTTSARPLRSSKYKNKHKNDREQCTLLDFVVTRTKQATKKKQPRWPIMKNLMEHRGLLPTPKRKGKTRLVPKPKVTPLKRKIKKYRIWKQTKRQEVQTQNTEQEKISETNIEQQQLKQELVILSETQPSTALLVDQVQYGLKELVLDEAKQPNATRLLRQLHTACFGNSNRSTAP